MKDIQIKSQVGSYETTTNSGTSGGNEPNKRVGSGNGTVQESDDLGDARSLTSTIRYNHEPFGFIQYKIVKLMAMRLGREIADIQIERMKGGTYNRIFGVQVRSTKPNRSCLNLAQCFRSDRTTAPTQEYIVRVPRKGFNNVKQQVATLKAIVSRISLPTPEVVAYDITSDNIIGAPYMIQKRLPGRRITDILDELNEDQMISMTEKVTDLVSQIASIQATPGHISPDNLTMQGNSKIIVNKLQLPGDQIITSNPQEPLDHLLERCQQWSKYETEHRDFHLNEVWNGFAAISKSVNARGFLDGPCVLVHGDLREYNLLAEVRSSIDVEITGVIDWDEAFFAPKVIAYQAPFWLWTFDEAKAKHTEEKDALIEPTTVIDQAARDAFMRTASKEYKFLAFSKEAILARRMYNVLRRGIFGDAAFAEANSIIEEWGQLHPEDDLQTKFVGLDN